MRSLYSKTFWPVIMILSTAMLSGCVTNHADIPADSLLNDGKYDYIIGPGDGLDIFVWGYEDLSITLPVRPDGKITTRLVEDMEASGKTPTELARDIELEYAKFVKKPIVTVTVSGFVGTSSQQIKVVGAGSAPQAIPYTTDMTLLDLMIAVGGLGEFSSGNRSVLVRKIEGERVTYKLRIADLLKNGDITANTTMQPGDIVIIPESWF